MRYGSEVDARRTDLANTVNSFSGPGEPTTVDSVGLVDMLVLVRAQVTGSRINVPLSTAGREMMR